MNPIAMADLRWKAALVGWGVMMALLAAMWWNGKQIRQSQPRMDDSLIQAVTTITLPHDRPDTLLRYNGFDVHFNPSTHLPNYVAYELTAAEARGTLEREGKFHTDPHVRSCATPTDYAQSGYDRGHLVPAGDLRFNTAAMRNSFVMTNIVPQSSRLNEGGWARLEEKIREWALRDEALLVMAGPVVTAHAQRIGPTGVAVPEQFFKVVVAHHRVPPRAIAFVYDNAESDGNLADYAVPVDSLERLAGIRLFDGLPAPVANALRGEPNLPRWLE